MSKRVLMSVLPGEPTDGTGRSCIHFVVPDERGPFTASHMLHSALDESGKPVRGKLVAKPTRARLACSPTRTPASVTRNGVTKVTLRTGSPRAVTCPKCLASANYIEAVKRLEAAEAAR